MKRAIILTAVIALVISSCSNRKTVADTNDYSGFMIDGLVKKEAATINQEIDFWQKRLQADTGSYVNMAELASYQLRLFKLTGDISSLRKSDSLLKRSSAKLNHTNPELLYSLSQNSVMQHQFINAASYINEAEKAKGDLYTIRLLQFDAYMELGRFGEALKSLESLKEKDAFDYLIRKAKWEDHKGNLDEAIVLMEKAFEKVKDKNKNLYCWTLSNLADMYGHAGRVKESYNGYLSVLRKDPANLYCLKGIAWIAYSNDHNTAEATRILDYILTQTSMPDLKLMLAEIAEMEGNLAKKEQLLKEFTKTVSAPGYGDMYNKYLIAIYTEQTGELEKAHAIAEKELQNRFTPETCGWMAWVEYKMGNIEKATELVKGCVTGKTFEPEAQLQAAYIFAAAGQTTTAKTMLKECLESGYELGPVTVREIKEKIAML